MAAILAVGTIAATTTIAPTQSAFAYPQKKKGDENSRNGNTITIQKCKQAATQSGFDNNQAQECACFASGLISPDGLVPALMVE